MIPRVLVEGVRKKRLSSLSTVFFLYVQPMSNISNGNHDPLNLGGMPDFSASGMNYDSTDLTSVLEGTNSSAM